MTVKLNKKPMAMAALAGILALGAVGGTLAYLTDSDETTEVFTAGKVRVHIDGKNQDLHLVPGSQIDLTRNVIVEQGNEKSFVRAIVRIKNGKKLLDLLDKTTGYNSGNRWLSQSFGQSSNWISFDATLGNYSPNKVVDGNDLVVVYYYGGSAYTPVEAASQGDVNLGSFFTSFTVPTAWDHADLAALEGLAIQMEVQAIQADNPGYASTGTPNMRRAWDFWTEQNGHSDLVPASWKK